MNNKEQKISDREKMIEEPNQLAVMEGVKAINEKTIENLMVIDSNLDISYELKREALFEELERRNFEIITMLLVKKSDIEYGYKVIGLDTFEKKMFKEWFQDNEIVMIIPQRSPEEIFESMKPTIDNKGNILIPMRCSDEVIEKMLMYTSYRNMYRYRYTNIPSTLNKQKLLASLPDKFS